MIEERARSHRERVPHPRPEPVDGRNRRTKGRGEGGVASDMADKDRSSAKAPTLPDTQRRGLPTVGLQRGWGRCFRRTDPPSPTNRVGEDGAPAKVGATGGCFTSSHLLPLYLFER